MTARSHHNHHADAVFSQKATAYITSNEPLGTPLANPGGNSRTVTFTSYGCPVLSAGEPYYTERALVASKGHVLPWMDGVYRAGERYVNPELQVAFEDETFEEPPAWDGPPWPGNSDGSSGRQPLPEAPPEEVDGGAKKVAKKVLEEDDGQVEIVPREEWERRKREAQEDQELDESKVLVY